MSPRILRLIFLLIFVNVIILSSCTRDMDDVLPPPPPTDTTTIELPNNPSPDADTLQLGWTKIKLQTENFIMDIFFADSSTGYCISKNELYLSEDGGITWTKVLTAAKSFENIGMGSPEIAAIISPIGRIDKYSTVYATKDGGNSFDSVDINDQVQDIYFISEHIAFMVGKKLWKSTDGGNSWQALHTFQEQPMGYRTLQFLDELTGFVRLNDGLYGTTDGGYSWKKFVLVGREPEAYYGSVFFNNINNGFMTGGNEIARVDNSSSSINFYYRVPYNNFKSFQDLHFVSADTGYLSVNSRILKTTNSGQSWNSIINEKSVVLSELHFIDSDHGWACGSNGTIFRYVKP